MPALPNMPCGRKSSTSDEDDEGNRRAPFGADELHGESFRQPDDEAGKHGARHRADAAEDSGGEERQQQVQTHLRPDLHDEPGADAGDAGKCRPEQPDDADHLAHFDAGDAGEPGILRDRAHGAADRGAR